MQLNYPQNGDQRLGPKNREKKNKNKWKHSFKKKLKKPRTDFWSQNFYFLKSSFCQNQIIFKNVTLVPIHLSYCELHDSKKHRVKNFFASTEHHTKNLPDRPNRQSPSTQSPMGQSGDKNVHWPVSLHEFLWPKKHAQKKKFHIITFHFTKQNIHCV